LGRVLGFLDLVLRKWGDGFGFIRMENYWKSIEVGMRFFKEVWKEVDSKKSGRYDLHLKVAKER